jgi:hypothetical protein
MPRFCIQWLQHVDHSPAFMSTRAGAFVRAVCTAGFIALAVAMGIGRFAFTPVLPLMIHAGSADVASGGWLAAANYAGYLVGALSAARVRLAPQRLTMAALVAIAGRPSRWA